MVVPALVSMPANLDQVSLVPQSLIEDKSYPFIGTTDFKQGPSSETVVSKEQPASNSLAAQPLQVVVQLKAAGASNHDPSALSLDDLLDL